MEYGLGRDFGDVRVHTGSQAAESAQTINALAYTVGHDIVFGAGQYDPHIGPGKRLLAHELVHVVQQERGGDAPSLSPENPLEQAAEQAASALVAGGHAIKIAGASAAGLARFVGKPVKKESSYQELKEEFYGKLIEGSRLMHEKDMKSLRHRVTLLPDPQRAAANRMVDAVDDLSELLTGFMFGLIGLLIGFGEGIVAMVVGLYRLVKLTIDLVLGFVDNWESFSSDWDDFSNGLRNFLPSLEKFLNDWRDKFSKAPPERQSLMIGELFGQIEALILSRKVGKVVAGQTPKLLVPTLGPKTLAAATGELINVPAIATVPVNVAGPAVAIAQVGSLAMQVQGGGGGSSGSAPAGKPAATASATSKEPRKRFSKEMKDALENMSDPQHPLHKLVEPTKPGSKRPFQLRKTTRMTKTGKTQIGRYPGGEVGPVMQAGHRGAYASGVPQEFMLESAELNEELSGQVIESKGAFSEKARVQVSMPDGTKPVLIEIRTLKQLERLGEVPKGTFAKAVRVP
jgi:hypothetical protein